VIQRDTRERRKEGERKMQKASVSILLVLVGVLLFAIPAQAATQAQINASVAKGMTWLAANQNGDGSWGTQYQAAETAFAVLKFETHAINSGTDPLSTGYQYYSQVRNGLDYLFRKASKITIGMQPAGNPDISGDHTGVYWSETDAYTEPATYDTGIVMMAIAASTHPEMTVTVAGNVFGWTYKQVEQDAVDYMAWGQTDTGYGEGGWNYGATDNSGPRSDNSNSGYAVMALAYAEAPTFGYSPSQRPGFSCTIPLFVNSELNKWIGYIQNANGGSGYDSPGSWVNILKTGNLLFEMAFYGDTPTTPRVQAAVAYLVSQWSVPNNDPGWRGSPTNYQATYATMKGLEMLQIGTIGAGIDWFGNFADAIIAEQNTDGSWTGSGDYIRAGGDPYIATEWALLTLEKAAPPPPTPVGGVWSPVNMPGLIAPWIALALIALAAVAAGISSRRFIKRW
jgi:hypothetical protein